MEVIADQFVPSDEEMIVPFPVAMKELFIKDTLYRSLVVPEVFAIQVVPPVDAWIVPVKPTATKILFP